MVRPACVLVVTIVTSVGIGQFRTSRGREGLRSWNTGDPRLLPLPKVQLQNAVHQFFSIAANRQEIDFLGSGFLTVGPPPASPGRKGRENEGWLDSREMKKGESSTSQCGVLMSKGKDPFIPSICVVQPTYGPNSSQQ